MCTVWKLNGTHFSHKTRTSKLPSFVKVFHRAKAEFSRLSLSEFLIRHSLTHTVNLLSSFLIFCPVSSSSHKSVLDLGRLLSSVSMFSFLSLVSPSCLLTPPPFPNISPSPARSDIYLWPTCLFSTFIIHLTPNWTSPTQSDIYLWPTCLLSTLPPIGYPLPPPSLIFHLHIRFHQS